MPVVCYHVEDLEIEPGGDIVVIRTYSRSVPQTDFETLLRLVAPSVELLGQTPDLFSPGFRFRVDPVHLEAVRKLCEAHRAPVVTAMTACAMSICLDWYAHPDDAVPANWTRTEVGALVHRAKYYRDAQARSEAGHALAQRVVEYVLEHPVLKDVRGIAAIPSSQSIGPARPGLAMGVATILARALDVPLANLERVAETAVAQKNLSKTDDPDANQAGTMKCDPDDSSSVLLIDDLMRHGSTVNEAARALSAAGVEQVYSLTITKEYTGTKGYAFP